MDGFSSTTQNGEALLNDGSAIVFYSIFSARYFYELEGLGLGEPVDLKRGIAIFCLKSLGAVASGVFFAVGLLLMIYLFHRRFNRAENIVEVSAVSAMLAVACVRACVLFSCRVIS